MKELTKRVIVAAIGIPIAGLIIYAGGIYFILAIIIISSLGLFEFYSMVSEKGIKTEKWLGMAIGTISQILFIASFNGDLSSLFLFQFILFLIFILILMTITMRHGINGSVMRISSSIAGVMYVSLFFSALIGIRELFIFEKALQSLPIAQAFHFRISDYIFGLDNQGCAFFVFNIFVSIWICDSRAYFVGRKYGKHKIYPAISPGKSWEGGIAGLIGAIAAFTIFANYFIPDFPFFDAFFIGILIGIFGQVGDFAESLLKRDAGVKDSSNIIPGHGGILDRFDSILFVSPIIFIYLIFLIIFRN